MIQPQQADTIPLHLQPEAPVGLIVVNPGDAPGSATDSRGARPARIAPGARDEPRNDTGHRHQVGGKVLTYLELVVGSVELEGLCRPPLVPGAFLEELLLTSRFLELIGGELADVDDGVSVGGC
jgi:hypothetical protein